jgi:hypothetical protein
VLHQNACDANLNIFHTEGIVFSHAHMCTVHSYGVLEDLGTTCQNTNLSKSSQVGVLVIFRVFFINLRYIFINIKYMFLCLESGPWHLCSPGFVSNQNDKSKET